MLWEEGMVFLKRNFYLSSSEPTPWLLLLSFSIVSNTVFVWLAVEMMSSREHSLSALSTGHALLKGELGVSLHDNILSIIWSDGTSHRNSTFVLTKEDKSSLCDFHCGLLLVGLTIPCLSYNSVASPKILSHRTWLKWTLWKVVLSFEYETYMRTSVSRTTISAKHWAT